MEQAAAALKVFVDKLANFLEVLDLSFFVSGGLVAVLCVWLNESLALGIPFQVENATFGTGVVMVLVSYALGLVCFVLGRFLRRAFETLRYRATFEDEVRQAAQAGLLGEKLRAIFLAREQGGSPLPVPHYKSMASLLWAGVRQTEALKPSYDFLKSMWVRAAVYDGLCAACILWLGGVGYAWFNGWAAADAGCGKAGWEGWMICHDGAAYALLAGIVVAFVLCVREGGRIERALARDLVNSHAWAMGIVGAVPAVPPAAPLAPQVGAQVASQVASTMSAVAGTATVAAGPGGASGPTAG